MSDNVGITEVSEEAIAAFAGEAAARTHGVYELGDKRRGVKVAYDEESGYTIDIYIVAAFRANIPETAWNVQKAVYDGLLNGFGVDAEEINIHVQGVHMNEAG